MKNNFSFIVSLLLAVLIISGCQSESEKPNNLIIFTDDQRMDVWDICYKICKEVGYWY